jgi:hypothetical protein
MATTFRGCSGSCTSSWSAPADGYQPDPIQQATLERVVAFLNQHLDGGT